MRSRARYAVRRRRARTALLAILVSAGVQMSAATALASNFQDGSNTSHVSQRGGAQTGDAIGGSQVVGVVSSGIADVEATNNASDSTAESGDASASNRMSNVFVGSESTDTSGATNGEAASGVVGPEPVDALGPLAPTSSGGNPLSAPAAIPVSSASTAGVLGPPGPIGPSTADTPSASNVQVGDNVFTFAQNANVHTGAAIAGGQVIGTVVQAGTTTITASNTATNSESVSGDGQMNNTLDNARVGNLTSGPVGPVNSVSPDQLQVTPDPGPLTADSSPDILAAVRTIDAELSNAPRGVAGAFSSPVG